MKRVFLMIIVCLLLVGMVGCNSGDKGLPANYSGADLAKLLLASERLDAKLLKNEGDIFENGADVLRNLAATTSASYQAATTSSSQGKGTLTVEGTTFTFGSFEENCNSFDYFENLTDGIVSTCEVAADMIDHVKKYVRVVDKWVASGANQKFYLHVAENEEVLYELNEDQINICRRSRNTSGQDVYEIYIRNEIAETRMTYIPGRRYEFSEIMKIEGTVNYTLFTADCTKGYWEVSVIGGIDGQYNVTGMVMKEDICYSAHYDPQQGYTTSLQVISSDRKTDLLTFQENETSCGVTLHAGGFNGIQNITITASESAISSEQTNSTAVVHVPGSDGFTAITGLQSGIVNLSNGKQLIPDSTYVNGQVEFACALADYDASGLCTGKIDLIVYGDSHQDRLNNIKLFLAEAGLVCRRNPDKMLGDISRAYTELGSFIPYYRWNGHSISDVTGIQAGLVIERSRFDAMANLYETVKNDPVVDMNDANFELNISFAPITAMEVEKAELENNSVEIQNISLTVSDMTLFVTDEPYVVNFALVKDTGGGLIHLEVANTSQVVYRDTKPFTVTANQVKFSIPSVETGNYMVVAYISTADGIRASGYKQLIFTCDCPSIIAIESRLNYTEMTTEQTVDYETFYAMVGEFAYEFGVPSQAPLAYSNGTEYVAMSGNETSIATGTYRMAYTVSNGGQDVFGYVYVTYTAP